jgi:hypothetical protein
MSISIEQKKQAFLKDLSELMAKHGVSSIHPSCEGDTQGIYDMFIRINIKENDKSVVNIPIIDDCGDWV